MQIYYCRYKMTMREYGLATSIMNSSPGVDFHFRVTACRLSPRGRPEARDQEARPLLDMVVD